MSHIRRPLVGLLALFAGAIAIDRAGGTDAAAIATWVYLLAVAAVAAPLLAGGLRRARPTRAVAVVLSTYLVVRLLTSGAGGEGLDPYLSTTEAGFLACVAYLGRRLATGLHEIDETIGSVAFGESPALDLDGPRAANEIISEMARSRRHDRPLSVTVLEPSPEGMEVAAARAAEEVQRALRRRFVYGRLATVIADQLRRSDLLFEHLESGRFVVVSPETELDGAGLLVNRIREAARAMNLDVASGTATFPEQAVTFEQLVLEAERRLGAPSPQPALRAGTRSAGGGP
jgi:hypothetical protein